MLAQSSREAGFSCANLGQVMPRERERTSSWLFEIRIRHLSCLREHLGMTGRTVVPLQT
jgi:hypothetical protein